MQAGLEGLAFSSAESWKKVGEVDTCRAQKNEWNGKPATSFGNHLGKRRDVWFMFLYKDRRFLFIYKLNLSL